MLIKLGFETKDRMHDLAAGAVAGSLSSLAVAPIDTVADTQRTWKNLASASKTERAASKSAFQTAKQIYRESGVRGFYAGTPTKMLKLAPAGALSFMLYGLTKDLLSRKSKNG